MKCNSKAKRHPALVPTLNARPHYDREYMAADLLDWVEDPDSWDIKKWRIKHKIPRQRVMEMCKDSETFRDAYAYAFDVIALRRTEMNHLDEMKDSLYSLHARVYDKDLDDQRKDEKKFEIDAKQLAADKDKEKNAADIHTLAAYISGLNTTISTSSKS